MNKHDLSLEELKKAVLEMRLKQRRATNTDSRKPVPILPALRDQPLPLSLAQQRLWLIDQLDRSASVAYHLPAALRLMGRLDRTALTATLNCIIARHESLRTRFVFDAGQATQVIEGPEIGFALVEHDLRSLTGHEQDSAINRIGTDEALAPFDLSVGPLIRGRLLRLADDEHVLMVTQHHIVSDGWSIGILIREFSALYTAFSEGLDAPLPALPIQYADYAVWQRQWLAGEVLQQQIAYWKNRLAGGPALLDLPTDYPRPATQSYAGGRVKVALPAALTASLRALAQRHGATLFMTLLSGWSVLLARTSGQDDIVIGTPVANRQRTETESLIGFFVNTLPLRVQLESESTVAELLGQIRNTTLDAYAHQDVPFEQVVEALNPQRSLAYSPLFQVLFVLNNIPGNSTFELPGIRLSPIDQSQTTAHFDLTLSLNEGADRVTGNLEYASDLFAPETIERLAGHFQTLLEGMVENEHQQISALPMLSAAERHQLLVEFNDTAADYPAESLIHQLFEDQVARQPDAIALVYEDRQLSYAELNRRANRVAHHLIGLGVQPDDRVAICAERSLEMVIGLLGILKAGGAYVPLDPAYPRDRLAYMLRDSAPLALLTPSALRDKLPPLDAGLPIVFLDADDFLRDQADTNPDPAKLGLNSRHLAYVIYTSGSTGQPKGVMNQHNGVVNRLLWAQSVYRLSEQDRVLQKTSFAFDVSVWEFFLPLLAGARLVMARPQGHQDAQYLDEIIAKQKITTIHFVPSMLDAFLHNATANESNALRRVLCSGEALSNALVNRFAKRFPGVELHNLYGPTEAAIDVTSGLCDPGDSPQGGASIGRPIANTQIYILDAQLQPVPLGVTGEIHIGGAGLARGYLNRPELTAERFIANPFGTSPEDRLYKTGDLGRWLPDGTIAYVGRNDFQVKIRGFRIELGEIEAKLAACAGVRETIVIAREDNPGDKRLVAYMLPEDGATPAVADLRTELAAVLPDYMVPSAFVTLEQFPLTPNGKLDRRALPAPDQSAVLTRAYEAPQGEVEIAIAGIWQELLGLEQVGRHDHFFELGGHSLMIISMIERLRQQGLHADVQTFFTSATLADLAAAVTAEAAQAGAAVPPNAITADTQRITPDLLPLATLSQQEIDGIVASVPGGVQNVQDIYPLAPLQEGILFHHLLETRGDAYLLRSVLAFDNRQYLDRFLQALQIVIDRHDILRSAVRWTGLAQPVQVVYRQAPLAVEELALSARDERSAEAQLLALTDPRQTRLDLQHAPLIKPFIAKDPHSETWFASLLHHHIALDHITLELVMAEIQAILADRANDLPPALPYRNFIAQLRSVSESEHESYFRQQLGDISEATAPFDVMNVRGGGGDIREKRERLDPELSKRIRVHARAHGVTPAALFHAAWAQVLAQCCGRDDVVFGTVLSGRFQGSEGAERVLGMFINTLPVRFSLAGMSVQQLVADAHVRLSALLSHEQASLALAQRCSDVPASLPLFTSLLNYRHNGQRSAQEGNASPAPSGMRLMAGEERTNYPITLSVDDYGLDFGFKAQTSPELDPERLISYLETAVAELVDALEQMPQRQARNLSVLPPAERQQVLVGFNDTAADYPAECLIHQLFEDQVARQPDAIALVYEDRQLSYEELNRRANQVAHHLIGLGIQSDDRVAICAERSLEMIVGLLGILKAGGAYVPLDPAYPRDRLEYMLRDSAPVALLTLSALQGNLSPLRPDLPVVLLDGADTLLCNQPATNPDPAVLGLRFRHLAYVIYTSGSTGRPKGVMIEHRSVLRLVFDDTHVRVTNGDCVAHCANPAFDASTWEIWTTLLHGAKLLVISQADLLAPSAFSRVLEKENVSILHLTIGLFNQYADALAPQFRQLHYLLFGGEQSDVKVVESVLKNSPPQHLIHCYGPTETTTFASTLEVETIQPGQKLSIGRPIANTRIYILDAHLQPVPVGVTGEIHIGGAGVARGYLNRPELTAEKFISDPFSAAPQDRLYKTGDLGRWLPDGTIAYVGRNDFQVKIRGFRIELGEIEAKLVACDGVREAVVIAREDDPGDKRLVAYVLAEEGTVLSVPDLRAELASALPEYMVPGAFVALDQFPLTPNGKLDRRALPAPDQSAIATRTYEAPVGEVENAIARIWQELLGLERVGRHDHFFELGGHSLMIISMLEHLRKHGLHADVQTLYTSATLADLAAAVTAGAGQLVAPVPPNGITADTQVLTPDMLPLASLSQQEIDQIIDSVPGGVHNIQDIYPLAPLQEGILFHHLLETKGDAYLLRTVLAFDSRQHLDRFLQALQIVIDRHDILRSAVRWTGLAQPVQVVYRHAPLPVEEFVMAADDQHSAQQQLLALTDPRQTRLDLQQAPLIKPYIAKDPHSGEWLASLLNHHIVSDHITLELVMAEIQAILAGRADSLPASLPYRNFIAQARSVTESEHESYFRQQLGDITETTAPFDVMDVRGDGVHVRETRLTLDPGLAQRIRLRARQHGVTPAALFHAAWAQVLAQCCGRDDVVFGTILSGRLQGSEGADRVLGMFINTLPVRFSLAGLSVKQLVVDAHERLSALLSHEQASLALAQRCSNVPASLPLFTSLLNYRHSDGIISEQGAATTAVASEGMRILGGEERTNYPLTLSVDDLKQGFNLTALCVDGIDPARIAAYLHTAMERLVDALSQDPQRPVSAISILPAKEEHQLLVEFNDTAADYPRDQLIHQLFEAQAEQRADATALVFEKRSMSYGELNRRANRVAHHLIALGIQPDDRVAICVERSLEMVVGLLGILKAGGAYVPLDPAYPVDRLVYMLEDSAPVALLTQAALQDSVKLMKTTGPAVPVLLLDADNDASIPAYRTDTNPDPIALGLTSSNLAYIIYTSGSTGLPKGVVTQHQPVINLIEWVNNRFCVSQSDTLLFTTSLCFDLSVYDIFGILAAGGSVRIASSHDIADPRQLLRLLHDEAITFWDSAPAVFSQIVPFLNDRAPQKNKPCLRLAFFSGDWIPLDLPTAVRQEFPGCQVVSLGGATEATVWSNFYPVDHIDPQWASIPYGRPIQNARYYVLNAALAPCPIGVAGDLYIAGKCLSAGYHKRPELTAERFLQDPFNVTQDGRMYKTGDRARYWDDGNLEFLGRSDTQVKIRGFRIELGEIEARLADCDGVRQAVVLAREDQPGDVRLVAYLVHDQPGHVPDALACRAILRRTLPEYMLPAHFVSVPAIPLTPNGKIDRRALPAPDGRRDERGYVAPTTPAEELMTKIWAEALKIDRVGIHDNFFDMGGHSLLAMQVISRINAEFQRTVPLQRFFEAPTIAELARVLSSTSPATAGDIAKPSRLVWD